MGLVLWLLVSRKAQALYEGLVAAGALISFVGLLTGFLLGQVGSRDPDLQIGQFLATRPVTSTEMARTILKCEATGLIIAWTIWAASFLALGETLRALQVTFPMRLLAPLGWWYFPATLVGPWAAMGLSTPLFLTGRKGFAGAIIIGSMVLVVGLMLFSRFAFSHEWQEQFFRWALLVVGIMLVLGTVWSFLAAQKRSLIGAPTVVVAASVWGALRAGRHLRDFTSRPGELCLLPCCGHSGPGRFAARDSSARPGLESEPLARGRPFDVDRGPRQSSHCGALAALGASTMMALAWPIEVTFTFKKTRFVTEAGLSRTMLRRHSGSGTL